ncbi:unnamed protein product [Rangifer tarandus platyrhynchus]|uniref:Uncharacterized protein n=2 Tax=Rangifer tarandus platyrhynchus TaxID=3082113 RepID=A0ABN8XZN0_RANTA|nr:unnamed protein product [Rangifer tarandus platyrhynchus]
MARVCESCASSLEGSVLSQEGTVKNKGGWDSLEVQWLGLPIQGAQVQSLIGELISQEPQGTAKPPPLPPPPPPQKNKGRSRDSPRVSSQRSLFFYDYRCDRVLSPLL